MIKKQFKGKCGCVLEFSHKHPNWYIVDYCEAHKHVWDNSEDHANLYEQLKGENKK